jgi:hypothetical protein
LNRFASSDFAQVLLYNEVMPRRLTWGRDLETRFLARGAPRIAVPVLAAEDGAITIDGNLDDPPWPSSALDRGEAQGMLEGKGSGDSQMFVRQDDKGVFVAIRTREPGEDPHLRLALMPRFEIPVGNSSRYSVLVSEDGIEAGRLRKDDLTSPWPCPWQVATRIVDAAWQVELYIPFTSLDGISTPASGDRWRIACSVTEGPELEAVPVALWGPGDAGQVQNGVILVFGTP